MNDLDSLYRENYGGILATVTQLLGDLSLAEDITQESFIKAANWTADEQPTNPAAWLTTTAKNLAIDHLRRDASWDEKSSQFEYLQQLNANDTAESNSAQRLNNDLLRLIFTCCHPALNQPAQVALCLNTVCGLHTEEIAKAFLTPSATMSQRLWRAKSKIKQAGIAYQVPDDSELPSRLDAVAQVLYLIFNEGWLASRGTDPLRQDLCNMAISAAQNLLALLPQAHDIQALLALMVLQNSRRDARFSKSGTLITLPEQDRSLWHQDEIKTAFVAVHTLFSQGHGNSRYALLAAIAAEHSRASNPSKTNWSEIETLYRHLIEIDPSPTIRLNHAVAVAECQGPEAALALVESLANENAMRQYHLFHSTRGHFLKRLNRTAESRMAFVVAKCLTDNPAELQFLDNEIDALGT